MDLVYDAPRILAFVEKQLDERDFGKCTAIGLEDKGKLICGVIYHNYRVTDIEMSIATTTPRWATRGNIRAFLHYPFFQLNVQRVTALCEEDNKRAIRFLKGINFVQEGVARHAFEGCKNAVIMGMTKEDFISG